MVSIQNEKLSLVNIVVRTHNRSKLLAIALDSIYHQSYKNIEIIVVDHDSKDNTEEIVRSYPGKILYIKHKGDYRDTFNVWRDNISGDFISFIDDDDLIKPDCIEILVNLLQSREDVDIVFSRHCFFRQYEKRYQIIGTTAFHGHQNIRKMLLRSNIIPWNAVLVRKNCLRKITKFDSKISGAFDYYFWIQLEAAGCKFYQLDNILGFIRKGLDSIQFKIEMMSEGRLQCIRYYGKHLSLYEKLKYGYFFISGYRHIRHGIILLENGDEKEGKKDLLFGIFSMCFSFRGRFKLISAFLILISCIITNPKQSRLRMEQLFKTCLFRNDHEIYSLTRNNILSPKIY